MPDRTLELDAIQARADAATPGPWSTPGPDTPGQWEIYDQEWTIASAVAYDHDDPMSDRSGARSPGYIDPDANADFIAHARTDVPALVAEVERLNAERQKVRELHRAEPVALCSGTIPCDRNHLTCEHCGEAWPCDTAEIVYTAEEVAAVLRTGVVDKQAP